MKLYNGDCLEIMKTIQDKSIDAIITDAPYGTTACKWDSVIPFDLMWEQLNRIIKDNGAIVLFGSEPFSSALRMSNIKNYKYDWKWNKMQGSGFLNSKKMPLKTIEDILIFYEKLPTYNPQGLKEIKNKKAQCNSIAKQTLNKGGLSTHNGGRLKGMYVTEYTNYPTQLISEKKIRKGRLHPTEKPVKLMEYLIKTYTNELETVLDFTMGSGTTGVACCNLNRDFIGIELDKDYFKIAQERIKNEL